MKIKKPILQMHAKCPPVQSGLDHLATMPTHPNNRDLAKNGFICILMLILNVGGIAYVIARGPVDTGVGEEFVISTLFLVAPFIGACSAFRIARSSDHSAKIIGWLWVIMFGSFFVYAAVVDCAQYRHDQEILRR